MASAKSPFAFETTLAVLFEAGTDPVENLTSAQAGVPQEGTEPQVETGSKTRELPAEEATK
jgi:hypothetical protein